MAQARGLRIRQHERWEIELPVQFVVCDEHRLQVRFSSDSSTADDGGLRGTSIDISPGGLAVASRQFVPRSCEGVVRVFDTTPIGTRDDGTPILQRGKMERSTITMPASTHTVGATIGRRGLLTLTRYWQI